MHIEALGLDSTSRPGSPRREATRPEGVPVSTPGPSHPLLARVRKLLAKAEAEGVTPPEAQALTAKAAELMAKYGIDRARLAATRPDTDRPGNRIIDIGNPWAQVRAHLL